MNNLSVGITKAQVIEIMGRPATTAAPGAGVEVLRYNLYANVMSAFRVQHFVKLVKGKVDSYGKMGDFDSTKDPTYNFNIKNR